MKHIPPYFQVKRTTVLFFFLPLLFVLTAMPAQQTKKATGVWKGTIGIPGKPVDIIFVITETGGKPETKANVPDQGGADFPASETVYRSDSVIISFSQMKAVYKGRIHADSSVITGNWEQYNTPYVLRLVPGKEVECKRPQEPKPPFPYKNEDVEIENIRDGVKLAGTLSMPAEGKGFPAIILITGSGPQDRNEEVFGHKPFLLISDYLTRMGFAVLRYDDRGTAKSTGDFSTSTTADFANDAEAALAYLKTRPEINTHKIGLLGHSEGGEIAPMIASHSKDVAFIVLLAGPGIKGSDLLLLQTASIARSLGSSDMQIAIASGINRKIYGWAEMEGTAGTDSIRAYLSKTGQSKETVEKQLKMVSSPWFKYFLGLDPAVYLCKVTCPVLALNGTKDIQVPYKENLEAIRQNLEKAHNKHFTIQEMEGLNHLFQHCEKCTVGEYGALEQTMDPDVLKAIGEWLLKWK
jgi:fermentation-respiration switch protein FrsA (DUF1100 family)